MQWKRLSNKRYTAESSIYLTLIKPKNDDWELYAHTWVKSPKVLIAKLTGSQDQPIEEVFREAELIDEAHCRAAAAALSDKGRGN